MKNIKKYLGLLVLILMIPASANAEIVVKDTVTPEFIHNQGYSKEVSRIIEAKTIDPNTPIAAPEKNTQVKKFGWYVIKTLDPAIARPGDFVQHEIKQQVSIEDL